VVIAELRKGWGRGLEKMKWELVKGDTKLL
jgi:hypothetical protein